MNEDTKPHLIKHPLSMQDEVAVTEILRVRYSWVINRNYILKWKESLARADEQIASIDRVLAALGIVVESAP